MKNSSVRTLYFVLIMVVMSLACSMDLGLQPSDIPFVPVTQPSDAPSVPVTRMSELEWLDKVTDYTTRCGDALDWWTALLDIYDGSNTWITKALDANTSAMYECATMGGISNPPMKYAAVQNEIDAGRSDFERTFGYTEDFLLRDDIDALDNATTYLLLATGHTTAAVDLLENIH